MELWGRMKRRSWIVWLAYGLVALGVTLALVAAVMYVYYQRMEPKPPPGALTSPSAPSSVKPKPAVVASYMVPPANPKYLAIPALGINNTRVLRLGLTRERAIAVPGSIYDTGWYDRSSRPGQPGAMFIYGHVSSWTAPGIFYHLKNLKAGDQITVTRGDNTTFTYQVAAVKAYPYNNVNMPQVLAPVDASKPGLNLMTCTGYIISHTSGFSERLVVFATLVSP